jgi:predicted DsbA family dithiol-disulfide isomerase
MEQSSLVKLQEDYDVDIQWHGFELHPETPVGGIAVTSLFRGRSIEKIRSRMQSFAIEFGVQMLVPDHLANTRRALAMSEFARDQGKLDAFRDVATQAYWVQGMDLEKTSDLQKIAEAAGLDAPQAIEASAAPEYLARVQAIREEGIERMVTGVPTLFFGDMPVIGCQRYETFDKVAKLAGLEPRSKTK